MENYNCSDAICSEFIPPKQHFHNNDCKTKGSKKLNGNCHFMNGTNRAPVALVSYQGSGNTWVRGLLEQATGICTGYKPKKTCFSSEYHLIPNCSKLFNCSKKNAYCNLSTCIHMYKLLIPKAILLNPCGRMCLSCPPDSNEAS